MRAIFWKEMRLYLTSLLGYMVISVFLVVMGLFLWIFPGSTNLFELGMGSLTPFFEFAPILFMFLIPALTMRSFSEEYQLRTFEWLVTKPLSDRTILFGKFLACTVLFGIALIPTVFYVYLLAQLTDPVGSLDFAAIAGSYLGLFLIGACFTASGLLASAFSKNGIVAFLLAVFICFFNFYAWDLLADLSRFVANGDLILEEIGLQAHYISISRGLIDIRDVVYFLSFSIIMLMASSTVLERRNW